MFQISSFLEGINVAHTTILRWMPRYIPAFAKHWQRDARPVGRSWRVDETYSKLKGSLVLSTKSDTPWTSVAPTPRYGCSEAVLLTGHREAGNSGVSDPGWVRGVTQS